MKNYIWCIWLHVYKQQIKLNQVWNLNCTYIYTCDLYIYIYIYSPLCPRCRRSRSCASFASLKPWVPRAFCGTWAWSLYWQEPLVKKTTLHRLVAPTSGWVVWGFSPEMFQNGVLGNGWKREMWRYGLNFQRWNRAEVMTWLAVVGSWGLAPLLNRTPHLMAIDGMTGMANIVVKVFAKRLTAGDKASFSNVMWPILVSKHLDTWQSTFAPFTTCRSRLVSRKSLGLFFPGETGVIGSGAAKYHSLQFFESQGGRPGSCLAVGSFGVGRSVFHVGTPKHIGTWQNAKTLLA